MSLRDPIPTKYTHKHLAEMTQAQDKKLGELKAKCLGLSICGIVKAASKRKIYLIGRNGEVTMQTRGYARW